MAQQRFVELLTKELTEGLTLAEKQELDLLLQQNPIYKQQSVVIKEYWSSNKTTYKASAANFKKVMDKIRVAEQSVYVDSEFNKKEEPIKLWPILKYLAAALVLGTALYTWYLSATPGKDTALASNWQNKITAPREKKRLVLPDGTIVTLNSGTSFKYPLSFGGKNREVYLNGEAFFEVHKDRAHPFIIHTNKMNVRVLGTAFNIKSYDNESRSETSLIHGSIEVTLNDRLSDPILLKPHDKLIVQNNLPEQKETNIPNGRHILTTAVKGPLYSLTNLTYNPSIDSAAIETLWLKNKLVFNNEDFESIAAEMERWYGIQIVFKHEELKKRTFTAPFERETPAEAFKTLQFIDYFHYKQKGSVFYISK
jgi:ferric-dicitrate binding protein FerR (iron transport regulator)